MNVELDRREALAIRIALEHHLAENPDDRDALDALAKVAPHSMFVEARR